MRSSTAAGTECSAGRPGRLREPAAWWGSGDGVLTCDPAWGLKSPATHTKPCGLHWRRLARHSAWVGTRRARTVFGLREPRVPTHVHALSGATSAVPKGLRMCSLGLPVPGGGAGSRRRFSSRRPNDGLDSRSRDGLGLTRVRVRSLALPLSLPPTSPRAPAPRPGGGSRCPRRAVGLRRGEGGRLRGRLRRGRGRRSRGARRTRGGGGRSAWRG
jgi:hypothetical protein